MRVQTFIAQFAVEALDVAVLHGLSGFDVAEFQFLLLAPSAHRIANEFRTVINTNGFGQSAFVSELLQYPQDTCARQTEVDLDHRTLARILIHDRQSTKAASIRQAVTHEVHAPALIGARNLCLHWLRARKPFSFPPRHLQPQLLRDPMHSAVPHGDAFALQQCCQTPIAKAGTLCCQLRNALGQGILRLRFRFVPLCGSRLSYQPAGAAFAGPMRLPHMRNRRSLVLRAYHFFPTRSFNIVMSNACSATMRFSFEFSSSSCFRRLASLTSIPP